MLTIDDVLAAQQVIAGRLHRTPLIGSAALSARVGAPLYLKLESWQKTGSFKPRGVLNKIAALSQAERDRGLVTASAGNHAQALAWAASAEGIACTVVMPETAPAAKLAATQGYGGAIVLEPSTLTVFTRAQALAAEHGYTFVPPFADPAPPARRTDRRRRAGRRGGNVAQSPDWTGGAARPGSDACGWSSAAVCG